jgi:quercetin dioxygenase-like cupin family protein
LEEAVMNRLTLCVSTFLCAALALSFITPSAQAQDPTRVDSTHYKVVFENDQVRAVRIAYGPHEKSVMHYHPDAVAVFLTDSNVKMTFPDGTTAGSDGKAGQAVWTPARKHLPENLSEKPLELILVELKSKRDKDK